MTRNDSNEPTNGSTSLAPYINQRLSFDHKRCTVRYIGPVSGTSGSWLGVEWDNPTHGKHNGMHDGLQYFKCRSASEHAGSFIRSTRALRQPRMPFLDAVQDRYVPESSRLKDHFEGPTERIRFGRKIVEEVGFDKIAAEQAELRKIRIVGVERTGVVGVSLSSDPAVRNQASQDVKNTLVRVAELDLSANLIERWVHVAEIVRNLGALKILKLRQVCIHYGSVITNHISGNRFADLEEGELSACQSSFDSISTLWLEDILPLWNDIAALTELFIRLQSLYLGWNELQTIPTPLIAPNLHELSLAHNKFTSLASLAPLASLPTLTKLVLEGNPITDLSSPPTFPHLTFLDLASNQIPTFTSLNPLATDAFPALTSLRLSRNPFFVAVSADVAHMLSLARLPRVTLLDYSTISAAERTNAELYYLSRIVAALKETARASDDERSVLAEHPLWEALCAKHDYQLNITRIGDEPPPTYAPGTLGARLVTLTIAQPWTKTLTVRVPRTISIYALKAVVGRAFDVLPVRFRLIWETGEWDPIGGRGDEDEFSVESDDGGEQGDDREKGRFVRREVEVVEGTSSVGFWIDGTEAKLRLEEVALTV